MNASSEAEQVIHLVINGVEESIRLTSKTAQLLGSLLMAALRQKQGKDGKPAPMTVGQTKLATLLKEGCEIHAVRLEADQMKPYRRQAKKLQVHYAAVKDKATECYDIVYRASDAPIMQIVLNRIGYRPGTEIETPPEAADAEEPHTQGSPQENASERPENGLTPTLPERAAEAPPSMARPDMPSLFPDAPPSLPLPLPSMRTDNPDVSEVEAPSEGMSVDALLDDAMAMSAASLGTAHIAEGRPSIRERMQSCIARANAQGSRQITHQRPTQKGRVNDA